MSQFDPLLPKKTLLFTMKIDYWELNSTLHHMMFVIDKIDFCKKLKNVDVCLMNFNEVHIFKYQWF